MTTTRKTHGGLYTEVHRVVADESGELQVKVTSCCCKGAGKTAAECRESGNKTRCRCWCHSRRLK